MPNYPKIAQLKTVDDFRRRLDDLGLELPVDPTILTAQQQSPLAILSKHLMPTTRKLMPANCWLRTMSF